MQIKLEKIKTNKHNEKNPEFLIKKSAILLKKSANELTPDEQISH